MAQQPGSNLDAQDAQAALDREARPPEVLDVLDQPSRGGDIAERLRFLNSAEYDVDVKSVLPQLHEAIALASTNRLDASVARELVGATHELSSNLEARGDTSLEPILDELKMAVYHTTDVHPETLHDRIHAGDNEAPITGGSQLFEWHGSPIELAVVEDPMPGDTRRAHQPQDGVGSPYISVRLGEHDTWLVQIGDLTPFPLVPNLPFGLGRVQLGNNTNISREGHVMLRAMPPMGIEVTSKKKCRTHFTTNDYPDPATWNQEQHEPDHQSLLDDARRQVDRA